MFEMKISGATPAEFVAKLDEVRAFMTSTAPIAIVAAEAAPADEPRTRKTKDAKTAAEPIAAGTDPEPVTTTAAAADVAPVTYADVQAAVTKLAAAKGRTAVINVFEQFGVDHGSKLTEAQWPEAIATLTDKLGG